ncbi:MAG: hypothetical protein J7545_09620 [Roseofilum sp. SBFL]|uniref:hypothetical protein n=1 Tax=unclassified Roseofilum TaxID=2620099 RepID=UPI001B078C28|nr:MULTISPECIES: hypothetical protein [unclassified Roseofilum]MBP0014351.1 hypothetical protein [Roseofilum sp. SID3]MBP0022516.1 hypothetical protein [Roseofilum sp. SID2]MBP0038801.1 hypothetical protein [Roseofilum sp. SID1]MBP0042218.1 hypothetical protein [Roseofilum sp. SBFL]
MSSDKDFWRGIQDKFQFFLVLALLCSIGFLTWKQVIYLILMLVSGGTAAAMIPLYDFSRQKMEELEFLEEQDLKRQVDILQESKSVLREKCAEFQDIRVLLNEILMEIQHLESQAQKQYESQVNERINKAKKREQEIQAARLKKGLTYGCPPDPGTKKCPVEYPICVTENLDKKERKKYKGIYYKPGDRDYDSQPVWCFRTVEEAKLEGYRRSKKKQ